MIKKYKYWGTTLIWLLAGYLCWLAGVYAFSYGTSNLVLPMTKLMIKKAPRMLTLSNFVLFHITDFILIFLFACLLSILLGKRKLWFVSFMAWPIGSALSYSLEAWIEYTKLYQPLPSWVISWFTQAIIAYLFFTPLVGWAGTVLGNKWYIKRRQAQQLYRGDRE